MKIGGYNELPAGFGSQLVQNVYAMEYFASLPKARQAAIIEQSRAITTQSEMRNFINGLIPH